MSLLVSDLILMARQQYNSVNDDFFSDSEIYSTIYRGQMELALKAFSIEQTYTTTSVASQQEYAVPTNTIGIKRITYNGQKLVPYTFREDDTATLLNQQTTSTGTPYAYALFNNVLYLRPIPNTSALTIKIFAYIKPQIITSTSQSLEVGDEYALMIVNLLLSEMSAKNKNYQGAQFYRTLWETDVLQARKSNRQRKVTDAFQVVKNVDILHQTDLGNI